MTQQANIRLPKNWNKQAQQYWLGNQRLEAIQEVLADINQYSQTKRPSELMLQLGYYLYLHGDRQAAAQFLEVGHQQDPEHIEILRNLAVALSGSKQDEKALLYWQKYQAICPDDYLAYDAICMCYFRLKQLDKAKISGEKALILKDQKHGDLTSAWQLPKQSISQYLEPRSKNVIAFSLWGKQPRYLRGAIDNALARFYVYPDWVMRFYVDDSVPEDVCDVLKKFGCEIIYESSGQTIKQKLSWRFKVANDPQVGRFLVRDVDSVVNAREKNVVEQWIASDYWFHIMRDWWSHTDLILAGMWGGIAGVLPNLAQLLAQYTPPAMETPNVDQWFLRDRVWAYVKQSCLIHDRCFETAYSIKWDEDAIQKSSNWHVGQDVHAVDRGAQAQRLKHWIDTLTSLK